MKRSVSGGGRGGGGGGGLGGGVGFRRDRDKDSSRNRGEFKNRNIGGGNRPGKNSSFPQKQSRNEDGKSEKSRDFKSSRDQRSSRR